MMELRPGLYRHFKGNEYRLLYVAKHSETLEPMVVYQALYGEQGIWVRPASMWNEWVDRDDYHGPRFYPIDINPSRDLYHIEAKLYRMGAAHISILLQQKYRQTPDAPRIGCFAVHIFLHKILRIALLISH